MEIQTMRGVLIWGYPLSGMNLDSTERTAEHDLQAEQDMLRALQRKNRFPKPCISLNPIGGIP